MKTTLKIGGLCLLFTPMSAMAADFGYLDGGYAPEVAQRTIVERRAAYPPAYPAGIVVQRRDIVVPAQRPVRVIEQRIVEGPGGVTKTTRIYERSGAVGYGPRPQRDIPLASYPYASPAPARVIVRPIAAPAPRGLIGASDIANEVDDDLFD